MQIGAVFPQTEIGNDPGVIRAWAQAVEDMGYQHVVAYDHVLGAAVDTRPDWTGAYTSESPFHEVFVLFGYLAAVTRALELVTGVLVLPQRQTALVAKQAAEVDVLSGGRMRLGVGIGWNRVEYEALGESFENRGVRSAEQIQLLRALWREPATTFFGRWDQVDNAGVNPLPVRRSIPVWFGGGAEATLRRVGQIGDGWMPQRSPDERTAAMLDRMRGYAREAGRDPADVGVEARLSLYRTPAETVTDWVAGWRDLGATHLGINTMGLGLRTVEDHLDALRTTFETVRPIVKPA